MAQSIDLGGSTFLDASAVDGIKGYIDTGDNLNNYYGMHSTGMYYVSSGVTNAPTDYVALIVISGGTADTAPTYQLAFNGNYVYARIRSSGSWGSWRRVALSTWS